MKRFFAISLLIFAIILMAIPFFAQTSTTICEGSAWPTLTATCEGGVEPYTVTWTSPTSETYEGEEVELNEEGLWTWICEDDGATTCSSSGGTHLIKVEPTPEDVIINADSVCVNTLQPISATGVPAGYTLSWDFDSGATPATSTSTSTNVTYATGGTKTITLTITKTPVEGEICSETCEHEFTKIIDIGELTGTITCE
jgi:trimeric autotransporter adhesin